MNMKKIGLGIVASAMALLVLSPVQTVQAQDVDVGNIDVIGGLLTCTQAFNTCLNYCGPDMLFACYQSGPTYVYLCRCL